MSAGVDGDAVLVAQHVLQQDLERVGQPAGAGHGVEAEHLVGTVANRQVGPGPEAVAAARRHGCSPSAIVLGIAGPRPVWRTGIPPPSRQTSRGRVACCARHGDHPPARRQPLPGGPGRVAPRSRTSAGRSRLAGWVAAKRDHGGLLFVDLRDPGGLEPGGLVQLVAHPGRPAFEVLSHLRVESVVSVVGRGRGPAARDRQPQAGDRRRRSGRRRRGGAVRVRGAAVPGRAGHRGRRGRPACATATWTCAAARWSSDWPPGPGWPSWSATHLAERGFLEVQTPVLTASSPEGARDFLVPSRLYPGEFYALPQAPQQFKQLLMVGGVERYFQIAPCFRDEASRADRSPGRVLPDRPGDGLRHPGGRLRRGRAADGPHRGGVLGQARRRPTFPRLGFAEAIDRYGTDKPDLRFGLEIADVTAALGGRTELPMFTDAPAAGPRDPGAAGPGGGRAAPQVVRRLRRLRPRKVGVAAAWLQLDPGGETRGSLSRKLTPCRGRGAGRRRRAPARRRRAVRGRAPGRGRRRCSASSARRSAGSWGWPTRRCWRSAGSSTSRCSSATRRPAAGTSPTTRSPCPRAAWRRCSSQDPGDILAYQYDLVCNGVELSSGAVRNHLPEVMEAAFAIAGLRPGADPGVVPGPVERLPLRAAAPRRHRPRLRPHPHAPRGPGQPAGGDRLPAQPGGPGPADGGAEPGLRPPSSPSCTCGSCPRRRSPGRARCDRPWRLLAAAGPLEPPLAVRLGVSGPPPRSLCRREVGFDDGLEQVGRRAARRVRATGWPSRVIRCGFGCSIRRVATRRAFPWRSRRIPTAWLGGWPPRTARR